MVNEAVLLLGSNLGDRKKSLGDAELNIEQRVGEIKRSSAVYQTEAWGLIKSPDFLNKALLVNTSLDARGLLGVLLGIESDMGRIRAATMGDRIIDIDLLFFNRDTISEPGLEVPHPRLHLRRFCLLPLNDIIPDFIHPVLHQTIACLLAGCGDSLLAKHLKK